MQRERQLAAGLLLFAALALCLANVALAAPPYVTSGATDWVYHENDGRTIGHYKFWWWKDMNVERFQNLTDPNVSQMTFVDYGHNNETTVYFFVADGSCCIGPPSTPQGTLQEDIDNNLPNVANDSVYIGAGWASNLAVQGWRFTWSQDGKQVVMWLDEQTQMPVKLSLPHNGRYVTYDEVQTTEPDAAMYVEQWLYFQANCPTKACCYQC